MKVAIIASFVYLFGCFGFVDGASCSCEDLKLDERKSGEYSFYNNRGEQYKVYCEFHRNYGYTFISKEEAAKADFACIGQSHSQVLVRHLRSNGHQYDTVMKQISSHSSVPLNVQYKSNVGYARPQNHVTFGPYIYLGFLPASIARSKTKQGYRANDVDYTFTNCDANPNSYLAFFVNPNHNDPYGYYKRCCYTKLMRDWIDVGKKASKYLPYNYFYQFEMHMGGCGGYAINGYNTFNDIVGAALGFRFSSCSCEDLKLDERKSGEYSFYNSRGEQYKMYCEFHRNYGYTFISKEEAAKADFACIGQSHSQVLVRQWRSNGHQYDTVMKQISSHSSVPLNVQYNSNVGYARPHNHAAIGPYIYLGFLPTSIARSKTKQGYRANDVDYTFTNCDANPNSYLAFFVNPNHNDPYGYYKRCCYTKLMRDWINVGKKALKYLPRNYFYQFEMHKGGCGGYAINGYNTLNDIVGAALGFRF
ncbi:uncharacterized protein LOC132753328 [Ruditapes philippinarum]|uniref:uncharacterized protein LOC132753328 n=1 Tax=Ruditapes philippinarum TaxID=129788 RepID=UPI00295C201E|nr:uncharacterized protein LOC132753328 [Ruditapes philippinarum]